VRFLVCCNGELQKTECYTVPVGTSAIEFPAGCTVVKAGFCEPLSRRFCIRFSEEECVMRIFNCLGVDGESDDSDL